MKKYILLVILISFFQCLMGQRQEWTDWKSSPCYTKIEYRYKYVKQQGERHMWLLQFRNNYTQQVYFNYAIAGDGEEEHMLNAKRKQILPKKESGEIELYTNSRNFNIEVGKLAFHPSSTDYERCDN